MQPEDELTALWQGIEGKLPSADMLTRKARRRRWQNRLITVSDLIANGVIGVVAYQATRLGLPWLFEAWLWAALALGLCLVGYFHRIRQQSLIHLTDSTQDYAGYLRRRAEANIRIGRIFILVNHLVLLSLALVTLVSHVILKTPFLHTVFDWWFAIGWSALWYGLLYGYGRYKIRKGRKRLANMA